jgi:hypothetical protein
VRSVELENFGCGLNVAQCAKSVLSAIWGIIVIIRLNHDDRIHTLFCVLFILLISSLMPVAHAEIYKCTDEFGNVAYLQTPCPAEKVEETEVPQDEEMPESSPEPQTPEAQTPSSRRPGEPIEDCKKRYRDHIDEIDAGILATDSPSKSAEYKEQLLALTRQLRACV